MPAKAGIQFFAKHWMPAFAGTSGEACVRRLRQHHTFVRAQLHDAVFALRAIEMRREQHLVGAGAVQNCCGASLKLSATVIQRPSWKRR